jgi:hypothetical protein
MAPGVTDLLLSRWRGDERAFGLGDLVGVARTCIIENGPEPIAAQGQAYHGEWLPGSIASLGGKNEPPRNTCGSLTPSNPHLVRI